MKEREIHAELASIRDLMERSSKFMSLSGLSGVLAGIYALIGARTGYGIVYAKYGGPTVTEGYAENPAVYHQLVLIALSVLVLSIATCILLSIRQAKRNGQQAWNPVSRRMLGSMAVPLATGGLFIIILLTRAQYDLVSPACLLFYGLSLVAASQYTFRDIKWLGLCEVALGLVATFLPAYALLCWVLGFGILHIVYGTIMHVKYDRR
jgi:uncharacterized membrane protein HdeD (DUF308 family)